MAARKKTIKDLAYFEVDVGPTVLQRLIGVSHETLRKRTAAGILPKSGHGKYPLVECLKSYFDHLREQAGGRGSENAQEALAEARANKEQNLAEISELKLNHLKGVMVHADEVQREWDDILVTVRSAVLAAPNRVVSKLPHLSREDLEIIRLELYQVLSEVADDKSDGEGNSPKKPRRSKTAEKIASESVSGK